jgi:septal ring factor EnvC (AmiA/AmiB activator)
MTYLAATDNIALLGTIIAIVVGGGGIGAWVLLRPQRDSLITQASEQAVRSVREALEETRTTLREQLALQKERMEELESQLAVARKEANMSKQQLAVAEEELKIVKVRVEELERRLGAPGSRPI